VPSVAIREASEVKSASMPYRSRIRKRYKIRDAYIKD